MTALFMVLVMVFTMSGMNSGLSYVNAAATSETTGQGKKGDAIITMGELSWTDTKKESYTFPNADVSFTDDQLIFSISVDNGGYFVVPDVDLGTKRTLTGVKYDTESKKTEYTGEIQPGDTLISMTFTGTTPAAKIKEYLRKIVFYRNGVATDAKQKISVIANQINLPDDMCAVAVDGTLHYYKYVTPDTSKGETLLDWFSAYEAAKESIWNGMHGYLATITGEAEQKYIYAYYNDIGHAQMMAWIGGLRTKMTYFSPSYWDTVKVKDGIDLGRRGSTVDPVATNWYWACGPEAGQTFYITNSDGKHDGASGSSLADINYNGWAASEPDNSNTTDSINHPTHQEYVTEYGYANNGAWNDYGAYNIATSLMKGYIVEYSPYKNDAAHGGTEEKEAEVSSSVVTIVTAEDTIAIPALKEARLSKEFVNVGDEVYVSYVKDEDGYGVDLAEDVVYQWQYYDDTTSSWVDYTGETSQSYTAEDTDAGKQIRCKVTAKDPTKYTGTVHAGTYDGSSSGEDAPGIEVKDIGVDVTIHPTAAEGEAEPKVSYPDGNSNPNATSFDGEESWQYNNMVLVERKVIEVYCDSVDLNPVFDPENLANTASFYQVNSSTITASVDKNGGKYTVSGLQVDKSVVVRIEYQNTATNAKYCKIYQITRRDASKASSFDVVVTNPGNTEDPSEGVTGPTQDTTASKGNDYVYKITLDSDVSKVTLTPDMANVTITGLTKNGNSIDSFPANGVYMVEDVQPGADNAVTIKYTVKDNAGVESTYTYIIDRKNGAGAETEVKDPVSPSVPKIEDKGTEEEGTNTVEKITITVPSDQEELTIYPNPINGSTMDTNYGTNGVNKVSESGTIKNNDLSSTTKPGFTVGDLTSDENTVIRVKVDSEDGKSSKIYEYTVVREKDTTGKFDVTPSNPDNKTNPSEGVTGPTQDTTASKGNDYVYKITLDSDVSKVTLTPDMANVTITGLTKNGNSIDSFPANGVYMVEDVQPGADNAVTIKYTVKDNAGVESTYTYIIDRKNGAEAKTDVLDPDPATPDIPKIEEKGRVTEGTDIVQKVTITVPADQDTLTIYPNPTDGAKMDTGYGTNGVNKVSDTGTITDNNLSNTTKPGLTVGGLIPSQNTVVRVKVVSEDGKTSTIYEYTIVREGTTSITPVDPADGKDTDKIEEKQDPAHPDDISGTTKHYYKVIEIPYSMKDLELVPNLPDGATVTEIKEGDVSQTIPANNKYTVNNISYGENRTVEYTIQNGTVTEIYHYTIKKLKGNSDTSIDTNVPDKTPTDPSDDATIDDSTPSKTEVIDGKTETVKDIIVKVPYKNTSVTLEPKVKEATSNIDTAYGDNGIKKEQLLGAKVNSAINSTDKKSGTITIDDLECGKENIVSIRVVAEDGSSCIYRYKVTRENGKEDTITPSLPEGSTSTGTITGPTEDTSKTTENDKYYDVVLPNGTDKVTMTPEINEGDKITSITVDGESVTIPAKGVYTVTGVTPDKAKDLIYTIETPDGKKTNYHYSIKQEKKPEEPKKDTPVDKKDPTITDITVKTEDNTTTPADVKIDNNNANKTVDITVPSNQTDYTFTPATKDPSSKITEVAKVSGPAEVSTSSDGKSFTAKGLDPKTPTIVKVTVTSSTGDTATYTVTIYRAEEGVTPDISVEMDGGSLDLNSLIPEDVRKNAKEILYHCCAHTVLAIDKDGTVRSIGRSNKYKSSLVHVIVKSQDNKWTDYTIYVKVNGATKKEEYGTLVDYKGLNYEITGEDTCRVSSWKTNYNTKKKNIVIPDTIKANGKTYKVTAIAPGAFMRNSKIVTIKIGKNVQEIGNTSFVGLRKIKKFTISKKNKYLKVAGKSGNKAKMILSKNGKILYSMTNMQGSVTIPKSVKQITEYAGAGNVKMTKLVIPASVKRIDPCAFAHAKKMTYVQFKGKVPEMANNCVVDQMNYKKGKVYVPKKYYKQYKSAFQTASKKRFGIKQFPAMSRLKKK